MSSTSHNKPESVTLVFLISVLTNVSGKQSHCKPPLPAVDDAFPLLMCCRIKRERIFFWEWTPWVCTSTSKTTG